MTNIIYFDKNRNPYHPYTMPMKKLQHIRVTTFREPLRTYERDMKGIEEQSIRSNRNYSAILATPSVAEIAE